MIWTQDRLIVTSPPGVQDRKKHSLNHRMYLRRHSRYQCSKQVNPTYMCHLQPKMYAQLKNRKNLGVYGSNLLFISFYCFYNFVRGMWKARVSFRPFVLIPLFLVSIRVVHYPATSWENVAVIYCIYTCNAVVLPIENNVAWNDGCLSLLREKSSIR